MTSEHTFNEELATSDELTSSNRIEVRTLTITCNPATH